MESKTLSNAKKSLGTAIKVADNYQEIENGKEYKINLSILGTGKNEGSLQSFEGTVSFQDGVGRVSSNLYKQLGMGASLKINGNGVELHGKDTEDFAVTSTANGISIIGREKGEEELDLASNEPAPVKNAEKGKPKLNETNAQNILMLSEAKKRRQMAQDLRAETNNLLNQDIQGTIRDMGRLMRMLLYLEQMNYQAADSLAMSKNLSEGWSASDIISSQLALEEAHAEVHSIIDSTRHLELLCGSELAEKAHDLKRSPIGSINVSDQDFLKHMSPENRRVFIDTQRETITRIAHENGKTSPAEIRELGKILLGPFGLDIFDPKYDPPKRFRLLKVSPGNMKIAPDNKMDSNENKTSNKSSDAPKLDTNAPAESKGKMPKKVPLREKLDSPLLGQHRDEIKLKPGQRIVDKGFILTIGTNGKEKRTSKLIFDENGIVKAEIYARFKVERDFSKFLAGKKSLSVDSMPESEATTSSTKSPAAIQPDLAVKDKSDLKPYTVTSPAPEANPTSSTPTTSEATTTDKASIDASATSSDADTTKKSAILTEESSYDHTLVDWNEVLSFSNIKPKCDYMHEEIESSRAEVASLCAQIEQLTLEQEQERERLDESFDERTFRLLVRHLKNSKFDMKKELNQEATILEGDKSLSQARKKQLLIKKQEEIQARQKKLMFEELMKQKLEQRTHFAKLLIKQSKERLALTNLIEKEVDNLYKLQKEHSKHAPVLGYDSLAELIHLEGDLDTTITKLETLRTEALKLGRTDILPLIDKQHKAVLEARKKVAIKKEKVIQEQTGNRETPIKEDPYNSVAGAIQQKANAMAREQFFKGPFKRIFPAGPVMSLDNDKQPQTRSNVTDKKEKKDPVLIENHFADTIAATVGSTSTYNHIHTDTYSQTIASASQLFDGDDFTSFIEKQARATGYRVGAINSYADLENSDKYSRMTTAALSKKYQLSLQDNMESSRFNL